MDYFKSAVGWPVRLWNWFWGLNKNGKIAAGIFVLILILIPILFFGTKTSGVKEEEKLKVVELINVGDRGNTNVPLKLVGLVESVDEAVIRSESSGRLIRVYKNVGDRVGAGEVIGQFENSGERAAVLQAEGALEQAKATRKITSINNSTSGNNLQTAKQNAVNTFASTFATMEDVIKVKTDLAFINPSRQELLFNVLVPDQILIGNIENRRRDIEKTLESRNLKNKNINEGSELELELDILVAELNVIKNYLDELAKAYNISLSNQNFTQAQLDTNKSLVGTARTQVTGAITGVLSVKQSLVTARASGQIAGGNSNPSIDSSDAAVKIAEGGYLASLSRLEKTIIRSPISGTLNSLTIKTGDFISPSQQVAVVSNNGNLVVKVNVSVDDAKRIVNGNDVLLNGKVKAKVTRIAQAPDPTTKKIEVNIAFSERDAFVNGESVKVEILPNENLNPAKKKLQVNDLTIKVPIKSVKISPSNPIVFVLDENSILTERQVVIGEVVGEEIEILEGLQKTDFIVLDARGLKAGIKVEIREK